MSFWSSVPYVTSTDPDVQYNKTDQSIIISTLKEELDAAIAKLPDKRNILEPFSASSFLGFSRDVPRFVMAKIYLMIGDYQKAKTYLEPVVTGGYYSMAAHQFENGVVLYDDCADEELIWGLQYVLTRSDYPCTPVLTYTDVLLDMCEICLKLEDYGKAQEYMNTLRSAYSQSQESWANPDYFLNEIYGWRKRTVNCRGEYFDFLRRTGLAKSELGLQDYQLLFPFPSREVDSIPGLIQNPGY